MNNTYVFAAISLDRMAGGLERNIVRIANYLSQRGHDVHLITFDWNTATSFYEIDNSVTWHKVANSPPHAPIGFRNRIQLILNIRKIFKDIGPAALVCFHHGILFRFMAAAMFQNIKVISSERNSLTLYDHVRLSKWNLNFLLMFLVDRITVQVPSYKRDYPKRLQRKIVAIPNAVLLESEHARPSAPNEKERFQLLSTGRLCAQKNYEALLRAFANLSPKFEDWDLAIVGDGEKRVQLETLKDELGLGDRVVFPGAVSDVSSWYVGANLFCLPSLWEGFPNALSEALAHGLPCVGYGECAGVRDLIIDGENGLLADGNADVRTLETCLSALMEDAARRHDMGRAAVAGMRKYHPDHVLPMWEDMLSQLDD